MMNKLVYIVILIAFIAPGCKGKAATPKKSAAEKPAATSSVAPAAVKSEGPKVEKEIYVYDPKDRRDPFMSLAKTSKKTERVKGATPIENFDVDEIKLIAIASDGRQYYALITLPDKKSFTIRKGMTLGLFNGKVTDITNDSVFITEQVKDYKGQTKTKDTILQLRKEEEE